MGCSASGRYKLSAEELALVAELKELGQRHLFAGWDKPPPKAADLDNVDLTKTRAVPEAARKALAAQLSRLNDQYPGGLRAYIENAQRLLKESLDGVNPFSGFTPSTPQGVSLRLGTSDFDAMEAEGLKVVGKTAYCLVAGGLGERLGYGGIKVELPSDTVSGVCYLGLYCRHILALQARARAAGEKGCVLPLAIMTSDDTHERTRDLLIENAWFGMSKDQVTLIKQDKVPALADNQGRFVLSDDADSVLTKPHGHGDVHKLLFESGLAKKWAAEGRRYLMFFQDTNGLVFRAAPAAFGVSASRGFAVNSITVPRRPGEAVGAICRLDAKDGRGLTCNVEYNQLSSMLRAAGQGGDVADGKTGFSPYPGNINVLVFEIGLYAKVLAECKGMVPEFVNPKYADASKRTFRKPTRLECMMQDYPKLLAGDAKVGFVQLERAVCFSAVKNNAVDALAKAAKTGFSESASSGEADAFRLGRMLIAAVGGRVAVDAKESRTFNRITTPLGAKVVLMPSFACSLAELRQKFPSPDDVRLGENATVVLDGPDISVRRLIMDRGYLRVTAVPGARVVVDWKGEGEGVELQPEGKWDADTGVFKYREKLEEKFRIRGYRPVFGQDRESREFVFDRPGEYNVFCLASSM